jgi:hypothetical protein
MTMHRLKVEAPHFEEIRDGHKAFEIVPGDRRFAVGDLLVLAEWIDGEATGRTVTVLVGHLMPGGQYGLTEGWVILSLHHPDRLRDGGPAD